MDLISSIIVEDWKSEATVNLWKNLKALDGCSLKSVDKGQLYELYNHFLHYSVRISASRQE